MINPLPIILMNPVTFGKIASMISFDSAETISLLYSGVTIYSVNKSNNVKGFCSSMQIVAVCGVGEMNATNDRLARDLRGTCVELRGDSM